MATKLLGERIKRKEDPSLVQGRGHYVDDIKLKGMLYLAFVRSPYGHAGITSINTEAARNAHGVVAILTSDDLKGKLGPVPCAAGMEGVKVPNHPCLAEGRVRYIGEPVVAIVATDRYLAVDAANLVEVEYDMLPAVTNMDEAIESHSPLVHESFGDNIAFRQQLNGGDWKTLVDADPEVKVIKQRLINQRLGPLAMETRGVIASYSPGEDMLTVWSSTQVPHILKTQLALMTKIDEPRCRVITPEVGGAFGSKLNVYGEEGVACFASKLLGRPVKWIEGRRENISGTIHGRDQINDLEIFYKPDGKVVGLKCRVLADMGAYFQLLTPAIPTSTALMILGCYDIPCVSVETVAVFTNKMATDAYRGAGRPEATYIIERAMNMVAQQLKMDPVDVRTRNFPAPGKDITLATGVSYDTANYQKPLKKVLKLSGYSKLRKEQQRLRKKGKLLGIGLSTYVEICAMGPSSRMPAGGWESGTVRVEVTGKVTVLTGVSPHGQGEHTSFAQIVAQELAIPYDDVTVFHGDTAQVPMGIGTFGSRATAVGGTAVYMAAQRIKKKMARIAAHKLGVKPGDVVFEDGKIQLKDGSQSVAFDKVAEEAYMARELPPGVEPGLSEMYVFEPPNFTYPFGAHVAVTEIDEKTGEIRLRNYSAVDDCGRILNPMLVDGQVHGGIAQGAGQALVEGLIYDENAQLLTGSLMDCAIPRARLFPWFETANTQTRTPVNPLGVKGVGEAGTIGSTPAIVNAVVDALSPLGVRHIDMPLQPEKIWNILKQAASRGEAS